MLLVTCVCVMRVTVFQMALYKKYDKMATEGLLAASNK